MRVPIVISGIPVGVAREPASVIGRSYFLHLICDRPISLMARYDEIAHGAAVSSTGNRPTTFRQVNQGFSSEGCDSAGAYVRRR